MTTPLPWIYPLVNDQAAALLQRAAALGFSGQLLVRAGAAPPVRLQALRGRFSLEHDPKTEAPAPPVGRPQLVLLRGGRSDPGLRRE